MIRKNKGSTTVFLCLITIIVFCVIATVFGHMRRNYAQSCVKRNTDMATEAEFSRYYRPLYDRYRLFYYVETDNSLLEGGIMGYFLENQKKIPDVLKLSPACIEIEDKEYAAKKEVENIKEQMAGSVKHVLSESAIEAILDRYKEASTDSEHAKETLNHLKEDIDSTEEAAVLEEKILKLLELVEGVKIVGGKVSPAGSFVKMAIYGKVNSVNAGVSSDIVWDKVRPNVVDMSKLFDEIKKDAEKDRYGSHKELAELIDKISEKTNEAIRLVDMIISSPSFDNSKMICDVNAFKGLLTDNIRALNMMSELLGLAKPLSDEEKEEYKQKLSDCERLMGKYHVKELSFDYSTLSVKEAKDPRGQMEDRIDGILSFLVKSPENISGKRINESDIYKKLMETDTYKKENDSQTDHFLSDTKSLGKFVGECADEQSVSPAKASLISVYLNHFFDSYVNCNERKEKNDEDYKKVLDYEAEYIVCGKESDEDNIKAVVKKLLLLRTGMSLVYLAADKKNSELAYMTAAAIVGFTGMDALVRSVQYAILAGWAYEDACVDVAALLADKNIAAIKNASSLNISYDELVMFNKEMLQTKLEAINNSKGINYETALWILLAAAKENNKIYRAMDLMELNMKKNFSKRFSFQKSLYKAKVHIVCDKPYEQEGFSVFEYK